MAKKQVHAGFVNGEKNRLGGNPRRGAGAVHPAGIRSGQRPKAGHRDRAANLGGLPQTVPPGKIAAVDYGLSSPRRYDPAAGWIRPAPCPIPRRQRTLRQAARQKEARQVAVIDFETDPFKAGRIPQAFACGFAAGETCETKWGEEKEVIAWAVAKVEKFPGIVYAHNGGKFDFPGYLFKGCAKKLWGEAVHYVGSRIVSVKLGRAELRDSFAILPAPLREHDKGKISYAKFEKHRRNRHRSEILEYLRRDCFSLLALVRRFHAEHGAKVLTAASAAMAAIKASGVKVETMGETLDAKFRAWYFGGMVLAVKPGIHRGLFRVYDIKSAYPHAMLSDHALCLKFKFISKPSIIQGTDFVCVKCSTPGFFPTRTKDGLRWPVKPGLFYVTGWEYLAAKKTGQLKGATVKFVERPERTGNFKAYVQKFYEQKAEAEKRGDTAGRLIAKILINSGYGKLAQRPDRWRDYLVVSDRDVIPSPNLEEWEEEFVDDDCHFAIWSRPAKSPPRYYNVAAAASITGFVRSRLIFARAVNAVYYCDTDSIITPDKINTGDGLGEWGLETEGDRLLIAGKKLYGLRITRKFCPDKKTADKKGYHWYKGRGWKIASKGARLTPSQLEKVAAGKIVHYRNIAPTFSFTSPTRWITRNIRKTA